MRIVFGTVAGTPKTGQTVLFPGDINAEDFLATAKNTFRPYYTLRHIR
jgi:hypothetical protein